MKLIDKQQIAEKEFMVELVNDPMLIEQADRLGVTSADLLTDKNRTVYEAVRAVLNAFGSVSMVDIHLEIGATHGQYLASLLKVEDRSPNFKFLCSQLRNFSNALRLLSSVEESTRLMANVEDVGAVTTLAKRFAEIEATASKFTTINDLNIASIEDAKKEYLERADKEPKVYPTGLEKLDFVFSGGLPASRSFIVAARPGHGKTTLATTIFDNLLQAGVRSLYITREMPKSEILTKIIAKRHQKDFDLVSNPARLDDWAKTNAKKLAKDFEGEGGYIVDNTGNSYQRAKSVIKMAVVEHGVQVVFLDYIGLFYWPEIKAENRRNEITAMTADIKELALSHDIVIVTLSQLNRGIEGDERSLVMMKDIKDSGGIEENADAIIGLKNDQKNEHKSNVTILKNRFGPPGTFALWQDFAQSQFRNWDINMEISDDDK